MFDASLSLTSTSPDEVNVVNAFYSEKLDFCPQPKCEFTFFI